MQNVTIEDAATITAYAPRVELSAPFRVEPGARFRAGVPMFKIHCVNMVDPATVAAPAQVVPGLGIDFSDASMTSAEFERFCLNEIRILNHYFKSDDGRQLVEFSLAGSVLWDANMSNTTFYKCKSEGNWQEDCPGYYAGTALDAFNDTFGAFRDDGAINVVYFDAPNVPGSGHAPDESGATTNLLREDRPPLIVIDYARVDENLGHDHNADGVVDDCGEAPYGAYSDGLTFAHAGARNNGIADDDHHRRGVEPHEMGHVFGLGHVCRQHPYDPADIWDQVMTGNPGSLRLYANDCDEFCRHSECQGWYRSSYFASAPLTHVDPLRGEDTDGDGAIDNHYLVIQGYKLAPGDYSPSYEQFGQAEIIMNFAWHYREYLD